MKPLSIRSALLVGCGIGVSVLLCLLSIGIYIQVRRGLYRELDGSIRQAAALLANQIEYEHGRIIFEWQEGAGESGPFLSDALFEYWNERSGEVTRSPGLRATDHLPWFCGPDGKPEIRDIRMPGLNRHARAIGMRVYPFIVPEEMERMQTSGTVIDPKSLPHILVVARDAKPVHRILTRVRWILGSGTLATLVIGYLMMELAIRISLRPIHELSREVHSRTGNPDETTGGLPADLPHELTGLVESFEALLARVSAMRQRERDFIRHAAHELRTPIAGLRATTELALSKTRDAPEYAAYLTSCQKTAEELGALVNRLSALARINGPSASPVKLEIITPSELIDELLPPFQIIAGKHDVAITVEPCNPTLRFIGDGALCRIILNNLLDNAVCYAPDQSTIRVRCESTGSQATITVSNPAADLTESPERLFEPLFRGEGSTSESGGHLGIGLALSLEAANAMGGTLHARKTPDGWIEFIFGLPAAAP